MAPSGSCLKARNHPVGLLFHDLINNLSSTTTGQTPVKRCSEPDRTPSIFELSRVAITSCGKPALLGMTSLVASVISAMLLIGLFWFAAFSNALAEFDNPIKIASRLSALFDIKDVQRFKQRISGKVVNVLTEN